MAPVAEPNAAPTPIPIAVKAATVEWFFMLAPITGAILDKRVL
jgi:hypothetical protein